MADEMSPEEYARLQKENCPFCKIVKGEITSKKLFEDDKVIVILDINPAAKGHALLVPKEHYPIMQLIPPEAFKHIFRTAKRLVGGIKVGAAATGATVFIANGAVAGQQSAHFLVHIIPREGGDGLDNFLIPKVAVGDVSQLVVPLQANMAAVMKGYLQREGRLRAEVVIPQKPPKERVAPAAPESIEVAAPEKSRLDLTELLMENPQFKEMVMNDPDKMKELAKSSPELAMVFKGVDIDTLSKKLREIEEKKKPGKKDSSGKKDGGKGDADKGGEKKDVPAKRQDKKQPSSVDLDDISRLFT